MDKPEIPEDDGGALIREAALKISQMFNSLGLSLEQGRATLQLLLNLVQHIDEDKVPVDPDLN